MCLSKMAPLKRRVGWRRTVTVTRSASATRPAHISGRPVRPLLADGCSPAQIAVAAAVEVPCVSQQGRVYCHSMSVHVLPRDACILPSARAAAA